MTSRAAGYEVPPDPLTDEAMVAQRAGNFFFLKNTPLRGKTRFDILCTRSPERV